MESANTVSATAWYLLRSECMFHVAKRIPGEEGTDGSDDGGGGGGGGRDTDGQWGSSSFPNVLVRRTYFGICSYQTLRTGKNLCFKKKFSVGF